eukprot:scaffold21545_cov22-Cyclotella_meneghiniana.AAC.1
MSILGLTTRQGVALAGLPSGTDELDNSYFIELMEAYDAKNDPVTTVLDNSFFEGIADTKRTSLFASAGQELLNDDEFRSIISLYAANEDEFLSELASAWTYLMNADRFDGPRGNVCSGINTPTLSLETETASDESSSTVKSSVLASFMIALGMIRYVRRQRDTKRRGKSNETVDGCMAREEATRCKKEREIKQNSRCNKLIDNQISSQIKET